MKTPLYLINLNPVLPVRLEASERSEMTTQMLFGEMAAITQVEGNWASIVNEADGYSGWVDYKMITPLSASEHEAIQALPVGFTTAPITRCLEIEQGFLWLPMGSRMYGWNKKSRTSNFAGKEFQLMLGTKIDSPVTLAISMLNTPYLWGGKTLMGIDCSGLVQLIHSISGVSLPRDARDQATCGRVLLHNERAKAGDLAFFDNDAGEIIHVGIMIDESRLIHASGRVRIDSLNYCGHRLHSLHRLI